MNKTILGSGAFLAAVLNLSGCATPGVGRIGQPADFPDTRLQYAILTEDRESLQKDFRMNPDRALVERVLAGFALPFAAATETAFWPVYYGFSSDLAN
jgi:hypothetical protein